MSNISGTEIERMPFDGMDIHFFKCNTTEERKETFSDRNSRFTNEIYSKMDFNANNPEKITIISCMFDKLSPKAKEIFLDMVMDPEKITGSKKKISPPPTYSIIKFLRKEKKNTIKECRFIVGEVLCFVTLLQQIR